MSAERFARAALLEAARAYADATDGSHGDDPHAKAVALRLAAKDWRRAERAAVDVRNERAAAE